MTQPPTRPVRVRFAPSPTGPLHIGGARSALFGWLLVRRYSGQFILRIEDTDRKRFVPGSIEEVIDGLRWLGIEWDEGPDVGGDYGPYVQSERLEHYQKWATWLVENDKAYRCYCTSERLKQVNEEKRARGDSSGYDRFCRDLTADERAEREAEGLAAVVRLKVPLDGQVVAEDLLRGEIVTSNQQLQDAVMLKSDGFPTYHLAHIIDDHLMEISHITRASEWLPSLPLHIHIWDAFGWEKPVFVHLPVLLNPNGKGKLSKRHAGFAHDGVQVPVLMREFQEAGYLPDAVVNFLINVGWSFGDEREIFTVEEAIERFDITRVNPANSAYPIDKLNWLNATYIRDMPIEELAPRLKPHLEKAGLTVDDEVLLKVTPLVQPRIDRLADVVEKVGFFFREPFESAPPEDLIQKKMDAAGTLEALQLARESLAGLDDFSHESQLAAMDALATALGLKRGQLFGVLRVAVTGQKVAPPIFETLEIIGKAAVLERLEGALDALENHN